MTTAQQNVRITNAEQSLYRLAHIVENLKDEQESVVESLETIKRDQAAATNCRLDIRDKVSDIRNLLVELREDLLVDKEDRTDRVTVKLRTSTTVKILGAAAATTILALVARMPEAATFLGQLIKAAQ